MAKSAVLFLLLGLMVSLSRTVRASDPDLTTDFGINSTNVADFTFTQFRNVKIGGAGEAAPNFATFQNLPGLTGLGLTAVVFTFGPESQIDPHIHPRATEIFYVTSGSIDVGFVDTNNDLFEATLQTGDLFVFPKGLLHFERNNAQKQTATAFAALSSENPGILGVNSALFTAGGTGLPDNVLTTAFGTDVQTVEAIKHGLNATS